MLIHWDSHYALSFHPTSLEPSDHGIPLPSYGNYGGPNYSAGVIGGTTPEPGNLTPATMPVDALDTLFYQHDLVFQHFQDGLITDPAALVQATVTLIEKMADLSETKPGNIDYVPEAQLYSGFATIGFVGELVDTGALQHLASQDQHLIASATVEALQNFKVGLANVSPGEARSLNGALHVFEAKYSSVLSAVTGT